MLVAETINELMTSELMETYIKIQAKFYFVHFNMFLILFYY